MRELEIAVHLAPANFEYRYRLGAAYLDLADFEKASGELKQAVALPGATEPAWRSLGQALRGKDDLTAAVAAYERGLQMKRTTRTREMNCRRC